jgi:hypothetical protein
MTVVWLSGCGEESDIRMDLAFIYQIMFVAFKIRR